ncbi:hypothetical protein HPB48_003167 [Haemaphysalis longicornis]|uniref:Sm domain-containing protein n=1 Tax=Haemaphysalis longicornis TaxID=44386 RepID=A0A9J6GRG8_HAELO|nr:hypothetical protein HPB48_003167 [Haemaphysalis longicornis]
MLQALRGRKTTVELRNELIIWGTVDRVDAFMNVEMSDVTVTGPRGEETYASFFVQGRQVRYVHIPDDIDMVAALKLPDAVAEKQAAAMENPSTLVLKTRHMRQKIQREKEARRRQAAPQKTDAGPSRT